MEYLNDIRACLGVWNALMLSACSKAARLRAADTWDTLLEEENRVYCVLILGNKLSQSASNWDILAVRKARAR